MVVWMKFFYLCRTPVIVVKTFEHWEHDDLPLCWLNTSSVLLQTSLGNSSREPVIMMQPIQYRERDNLAFSRLFQNRWTSLWNLLLDSLMLSRAIELRNLVLAHPMQIRVC